MPPARPDPKPAPAAAPPPPAAPPPAPPPFYEAVEDLYVYNPESGVMPVAAYRAGDRVPPDVLEPNGWADKVRVPDMFAGARPARPANRGAAGPRE